MAVQMYDVGQTPLTKAHHILMLIALIKSIIQVLVCINMFSCIYILYAAHLHFRNLNIVVDHVAGFIVDACGHTSNNALLSSNTYPFANLYTYIHAQCINESEYVL